MSQDPLGFPAGDTNLYRYVGNEATDLVDLSGMGINFDPPLPRGGANELGKYLDGKITRPPWLTDSNIEQYMERIFARIPKLIRHIEGMKATQQATEELNREMARKQANLAKNWEVQLRRLSAGMRAMGTQAAEQLERNAARLLALQIAVGKALLETGLQILLLLIPVQLIETRINPTCCGPQGPLV
jgi:hypothetical protein